MTVLLVDDQVSILSGLISGVDWKALGVTAIRTASNAAKAKQILEGEPVDILLCDIAMPGENGLDLLRWARNRGPCLVCVFLTSHANFLYAKEAIQLECFDYVLQPARYEDIQATVERAIRRVREGRQDRELESYGIYAKNNPGGVFQNLFSSWMAGSPLCLSRLRAGLAHFHRELPGHCPCTLVIGQVLRWHAHPWTFEEWGYALNNIVAELFGEAGMETLSFSVDSTAVGWFVYARPGAGSGDQTPFEVLERVYLRTSPYIACDFAFYVGPTVPVEQVSPLAARLLERKRDNVLQRSGVFPLGQAARPDGATGAGAVQMERWNELLATGDAEHLQAEVFRYLDTLSARGQLDYQALHNFWIQFQQVVLNVLWKAGLDRREILPILHQGETAQSLEAVKEAVTQATAFFTPATDRADSQTVAQKAALYVEKHLDEPLTVGDIAGAMFLNADYLTRLFRAEYGVSLKEYIVTQKMNTAQALLQTTGLPVGVIASKVGYDNCSHFSQAYKKAFGHTPTDERQK